MDECVRLDWDGERRGGDRRSAHRRAPVRQFDTLFATTLINQLDAAPETLARSPYEAEKRVRPGIWRDLKA